MTSEVTNTATFGIGAVMCLASGVPTQVGTIQDVQFDISSTNVTLMGQNQFAVAVARGEGKIQGKAKYGKFDLGLFSNLYLGQSLDTTGYTKPISGEAHTVPASSPYTVQVTNHTSLTGFVDLGVFYTSGVQLTAVTSGSEATGKYSVDAATGTYTFAAGDEGMSILVNYSFFASTGNRIIMTNQLMGVNPVFALWLTSGFANINGVTYTSLKLYSCVSSKISLPFKNNAFVVTEFDFDAFADPSGNILELGIGT